MKAFQISDFEVKSREVDVNFFWIEYEKWAKVQIIENVNGIAPYGSQSQKNVEFRIRDQLDPELEGTKKSSTQGPMDPRVRDQMVPE